jgi:hypothetical protein
MSVQHQNDKSGRVITAQQAIPDAKYRFGLLPTRIIAPHKGHRQKEVETNNTIVLYRDDKTNAKPIHMRYRQ